MTTATGGAGPDSKLTPVERACFLQALVDELIPGDGDWPSASQVGVHGILALRLASTSTDDLVARLAIGLGWVGGEFGSPDAPVRIAAIRAFEEADPETFDQLYTAAVLAYYETPAVVEAIRRKGRPYSRMPHITGYDMAPFEMSRDRPTHGRGRYITTHDVRPVDIAELQLETTKSARWGIGR